MRKIIFYLFAALLFFVPLILWPYTSEVFEFNKMVLVYALTSLILAVWIIRSIIERKFIFRRTILDTPLLIFLGSQFISTILSIDPTTSWLGYYSRFNGGLASIICYSLLYWAFVSNFGRKEALGLIKVSFGSAALVSIYGVLEHFGIDKSIWVQDVQSRVFSTLGQPNWLAAWLIALIPIAWALGLNSSIKKLNFWIYFSLSILFFWTLIFTKSRSGLLGFGVAFLIFWVGYFWSKWKEYKKYLAPAAVIALSLAAICLISGTEFTPSIKQFLTPATVAAPVTSGDTALETGGTESGTIRQIVWTGAIQIWLHYPVFGTGVETFAYSYYRYRPVAHNVTSEWDFIYNKAHNEFLNMAADSGTVGLLSYLAVIGFSILIFIKLLTNRELSITGFALLAGYVSLSVTNFFGFSVVPTQLEFFLFPAIAISLANALEIKNKNEKVTAGQKVSIFITLLAAAYLLLVIGRYWYADTLYAKGKAYNTAGRPDMAIGYITRAINLEPGQSLYHNDLATSYVNIALAYYQNKDATNAKKYSNLAISESDTAISLSPANVNFKRSRFGIFVTLSAIDPNYLINARDTLIDAITYAPTDAKLYYNLGLVYARTGQIDLALSTLKKTVELKADYRDARLAYAYLLIGKKDYSDARTQLEYILKYLSPNDSLTKQALESIK